MCKTVIGKWLALAALCLWMPGSGSGQEPPPTRETGVTRSDIHVMRYLDRNRDRQVDADELADGQELASLLLMLSWSGCDQDADGAVDLEELKAAVDEAREALAETAPEEEEEQATEALANAVPLSVVLDRLAADQRYADEIAELRKAVEDLDDDEAVVVYLNGHVKHYPRLVPVIRTWGRYYPVKPGLRRHYWSRPYRPPASVKPLKPAKPGPKVGPKPKPKPKPRPKPKRPGP